MAAGDTRARNELIELHLRLAESLAARYRGSSEPREDLVQVAYLALCKAVDGYDAERGTSFSSYAVPTILGEIKRHFRDRTWSSHVPRVLQERAMRIERVVDELTDSLGRSPKVAEIAEAAGWTDAEVVEGMEVAGSYRAVSLSQPTGIGPAVDRPELVDTLGDDDPRYELAEYGVAIEPVLRKLPARDRMALHLRFTEDLTQAEIGKRLGVSQMQVSRILRRSLDLLRAAAADNEDYSSQSVEAESELAAA
jgi:RNA polymerase sigma-B factor